MEKSVYIRLEEVTIVKGRRTLFIVLVVVGLAVPVVVSDSDSFTIEYQFKAVQGDGCCGPLLIEDTILREIPGEPLIPYYPAQILLPQGTEIEDVKVKTSAPVEQTGYEIPWGQQPCISGDTPEKVDRNEEIYNSDQLYPQEIYEIVSTESFRGFQILNVILYPMQYQPKTGTVKFCEKLSIHVQVKKGFKNELYRGLQDDKEAVRSMVDNPDAVETYGEPDVLPLSETEQYIIITNNTLQSKFQRLADHKACFVNGASVYTVSWIYSNYAGRDNQEKIRNFIKDKYTNNGTRYVLLGGDVSVVPYREFYISCYGYTEYIAADMYFAHLDGDFDADSDGIFGEPNDGVDWYPEVAVGRAPVETISEAENFVNKVWVCERAYKPKVCQFHQARITSACVNSPDSRCLAWNCDNYVPVDYVKKYLFEEDQTVTQDLWRSAWDGSFDGEPHTPPLVFQHMGDTCTYDPVCDPTCYMINCSPPITWSCSNVSTLTNKFWPWHTSPASCGGKFTYDDCLAECYVKDPYGGAIACFMNDNYAWYSSSNACAYSGEFVEMQFRALFSDGKEKFGDLLNQSKLYMISPAMSNCVYRWCFYEINLIGDPESPCLTERQYFEITNPKDGSEVSGTVTIAVDACECITDAEFFIDKNKDGWIDENEDFYYFDEAPPFECDWDTTTYPEGEEFTINVICYYSNHSGGWHTVAVTVNNYHITSPTNRAKDCIGEPVIITTSTAANIDTVKIYLIWTVNNNVNSVLLCTDTVPPFECIWNTAGYSSRWYTIRAEAYSSGELKNVDQILVKLVIC